jgi:hypothetical protein
MILREASGAKKGVALPGDRKAQYGLSDETCARGAAELEEGGLLTVEEMFGKSSQNEFELPRRRLR